MRWIKAREAQIGNVVQHGKHRIKIIDVESFADKDDITITTEIGDNDVKGQKYILKAWQEMLILDEQQDNMEELKKLAQDCFDTIDLLSDCLFAGEDISDDDMFNIASRLHDRFRAIAPDWHGVLPLETPERNETTEAVVERLKHS